MLKIVMRGLASNIKDLRGSVPGLRHIPVGLAIIAAFAATEALFVLACGLTY